MASVICQVSVLNAADYQYVLSTFLINDHCDLSTHGVNPCTLGSNMGHT